MQYKQTNTYKISLSRQITWFSSTLLPLRHRRNLKRKASVVQCKVMATITLFSAVMFGLFSKIASLSHLFALCVSFNSLLCAISSG